MSAESLLEAECGGKVFLTPSCTAALELACMMILEPGDEVIMPSWAFPSCANAVILRGGVPVFVDVNDDLNIDVNTVSAALSDKTKAIMPLHYAGVVCDMVPILALADEYGLYVIEDAAQAIGNWKVSGDFGCLSFHYTKNISCGQGGALIVNNPAFVEKAEMMMHCGTDKAKMYRGEQDGYSWLEVGSQYIMSDWQKAALVTQLNNMREITDHRKRIWNSYKAAIGDEIQASTMANGHIFWWLEDPKWDYVEAYREKGVKVSSHYEALHTTPPGRKYGRVGSPVTNATRAQNCLVKLDTSVTEAEAIKTIETLWNR